MQARRAIACVVLAALLGALGLPWIGDAHQFNDDPHWAVSYRADHDAGPALRADGAGDETHCEVCHWLRTMRTAVSPAPVALLRDFRVVAPPAALDPSTHTASLRGLPARAPPASL